MLGMGMRMRMVAVMVMVVVVVAGRLGNVVGVWAGRRVGG